MGRLRRINDGFKWAEARETLDSFISRCFFKAGICSGAVSTNIQVTDRGAASWAFYCIEGYMYSAAWVASGKYLPDGAGQSTCASGYARMWAVCLDSVGSVHLYAGSAVSAGNSCFVASVPVSKCVVGLVKVSCASNFSFTVGTHAWGSASITSTTVQYWDVSMLPQGVIVSD
jgi:hypothetical protein